MGVIYVKMNRPVLINFAALLFLIAYTPAISKAVQEQYVPDEIIVKFKNDAANTIEKQIQLQDSISTFNLSSDLVRLNSESKIKKIIPLFKDFRKKEEQIKSIQERKRRLLSQKEKNVLERKQRAPENIKKPELNRIYKIKLDSASGKSAQETLEIYRNNPNVEYAELNQYIRLESIPNDPFYFNQWALNKIDAPDAWEISTGSSEIIVAVIDTGVDYNHRDLKNNMWVNDVELNGTEGIDDDNNGYVDDIYGYNFIYNNSDPMDDYGHGTHCAGIIAAEGNNNLDITGVCWNTRIMAIKFMGSLRDGTTSDAVLAHYYAIANGADVISNSWSIGSESQLLKDVIDYAESQGVIVVAAAGNDYSNSIRYPAGLQNVISVAATNPDDTKWYYSNYGDWVDIAAPGIDILSLGSTTSINGTPYDDYTTISSGTSTACPYVAGACALILSANPFMSNSQVYNILTRTADTIPQGICFSNGRLNLYNAMQATVPSQGYINFDRQYYTCDDTITFLLADHDLKGNASQEIIVLTTNNSDSETIVLTETESAIGVFTGAIQTDSGSPVHNDGILQIESEQIIMAIYFDAYAGTDLPPEPAIKNAYIDCQPPVLLDLQVDTIARKAVINLITNEPTRALIRYGTATSDTYDFTKEEFITTSNHSIKLQPLALDTEYRFEVDLYDLAGNLTIADNNSLGYSFSTSPEFIEFKVPDVYPTIQDAIDDASDGATIEVADGEYTGEGNVNIDFNGKAITLKSENGPENCIIDCQNTTRGINFHNGEDSNTVLDGFTITNGLVGDYGGGIRCTASSPKIINCIIKDNSAEEYGGAMSNSYNSNPVIINCTFINNSAGPLYSALGSGGAICNLINSSPIITNCKFIDNIANYCGAAIYNEDNCNPAITKSTFTYNSAQHGGAIYNYYNCNPVVKNCIFKKNSAQYGGAIKNSEADVTLINCTITQNTADRGGGIWNAWNSASKLQNSILWNNNDMYGTSETAQYNTAHSNRESNINYCCIQNWTGGLGGIGNTSRDPLFFDPNSDNYHLKSKGWRWDSIRRRWTYDDVTSPCIDAGNPGSPLNEELIFMPDDPDNMWAENIRINMGAYGGTEQASMAQHNWMLLADLNNDGNVNMKDFAIQSQSDQETIHPFGDLNRDGTVNPADVALLAGQWLKYTHPPEVNIIYPQSGQPFPMRPVEIEIEAEAYDTNGSVVTVEFFVNDIKIGEDNDGSDGWKIPWTESADGQYILTARATDNSGVTTKSENITIWLTQPL